MSVADGRAWNSEVAGSSPVTPTILLKSNGAWKSWFVSATLSMWKDGFDSHTPRHFFIGSMR